jgi:single-strand DNA-binding protein
MSLNKVQLIGHLGADPDTKYTQGGMAVTRLRIATTERRKGKDGSAVESTEWHTVKAFNKLGEICGELLAKGMQVYIEGRIHYDTFEKDGVTKHFTEILADTMQILGQRGEGGASRESSREKPAPRREAPAPRQPAPATGDDFADDDIPF